ncbi:CAP domain-containing protein [Nocardioides sp. C4-1]|uniref:CAP domain-containing protein n=1 Tax=Nocardioides sp. C4-1 TaxID=3151851 RepID=UPI0032659517
MPPTPHRAVLSVALLLLALAALSLPAPLAHAADGPGATVERRAGWVSGWPTTPATVKPGAVLVTRVRVSGGARPVQLQRRVGSAWRTVDAVRSAGTGRAALTWRAPRAAAKVALRVLVPKAGRRAAVVTRGRLVTVVRPAADQAVLTPTLTTVVTLVNEARALGRRCGGTYYPAVPALSVNTRLSAAAASHAQDMAARDYFSHTSPNGDDPGDRLEDAGYDWRSYGENIAAGYRAAADVVQGWLDSPGHCQNIMGRFTEIGVGYAFDADSQWGHYWVQEFGTR